MYLNVCFAGVVFLCVCSFASSAGSSPLSFFFVVSRRFDRQLIVSDEELELEQARSSTQPNQTIGGHYFNYRYLYRTRFVEIFIPI